MEDDAYLPDFNDDDVLSFANNSQPVLYKVGKFRKAVREALHEYQQISNALTEFLKFKGLHIDTGESALHKNIHKTNNKWFGEGISCEILKLGATGWQKGRIKVSVIVEFYPDDSPQAVTLQQNSQTELSLNDSRLIANPNSHRKNQ